MKRNALKRLITLYIGSILLVSAVFFVLIAVRKNQDKTNDSKERMESYIIETNEVIKLYERNDTSAVDAGNALLEKLRYDKDKGVFASGVERNKKYYIILYVTILVVIFVVLLVLYIKILRPFDELQEYVSDIASGNLERELHYKRANMFGDFTWAFDHMRIEIVQARKNEQAAIENNKTVIATLSHDIKTPIASIRGYAEGLTMNMDSNPERRNRYAEVILKKCDEVTKITNDMFLHSLHDLDRLAMANDEIELGQLIRETVDDMNLDGRIKVKGEILEGRIEGADRNRIVQAIDNIIANARKYAPDSDIDVSSYMSDDMYTLEIRDHGDGIPDEDLPFVYDKFYRGQNVSDAPGAGLGLFIVSYIMKQHGGSFTVENDNGLVAKLNFSLKK